MVATVSNMIQPAPWYRQKWMRGRYRISDGHLTPVPGCEFEGYDPIAQDEAARNRKNGRRLTSDLNTLDVDDPAAVLGFVNQWGLLGCFTHYLMGQFRLDVNPDVVASYGSDPLRRDDLPHRLYESHAFRCYAPLESAWEAGDAREGMVLLSHGRTNAPLKASIDSYYPQFFPGLTELANAQGIDPTYPSPHSADLWRHLCEPLSYFANSARMFQEACNRFAEWHARPGMPSADLLLAFIQFPLSRVSQAIEETDAGWRMVWVWPSLLSVAYLLLAQQIAGCRGPRFCENQTCAARFIPTRPDKRFCGDRCQSGAGVRRCRMRKREAVDDQVQGIAQ